MVLGINTLLGRKSSCKSDRQSTTSQHQGTLSPKKSLQVRKSSMRLEGEADVKDGEVPTGNWREDAKDELKTRVESLEQQIKAIDAKMLRTDKAIEQLDEQSAYPTPNVYAPPPTAVTKKKPPANPGNVIRCVDDDEQTGDFDESKNGDGRCWKIKSWKEQQLKKEVERLETILAEKTKMLKKKRKELGKFMQEKGVTTMKVDKEDDASAGEDVAAKKSVSAAAGGQKKESKKKSSSA